MSNPASGIHTSEVDQEESGIADSLYRNRWVYLCAALVGMLGATLFFWTRQQTATLNVSAQLAETRKEMADLKAAQAASSDEIHKAQDNAATLKTQLASRDEAVSTLEAARRLEQTKREADQKKLSDLTQQLSTASTESQTLKDKLAQLEADLEKAKEASKTVAAAPKPVATAAPVTTDTDSVKDAVSKQAMADKAAIEEALKQSKDSAKALAESQSKLKEAQDKLTNGEKEYEKVSDELKKIKEEIEKRMEGRRRGMGGKKPADN